MMMKARWLAFSVAVVSTVGCGTNEYREESYRCEIDYTKDENNAWLLIGSLEKKEKVPGRWNHTKWSRKAPYTLQFLVHARDGSETPVRLLSAQIQHQEKTIVVHEKTDPPIEQMLVKHEVYKGKGYFETRIGLELEDKLKWVRNSKCIATAVVQVPWQEGELTIGTECEAIERDEEGHDLDALMGI
jgi:hypothetical protein